MRLDEFCLKYTLANSILVLKEVLRQKFVSNILSAESINIVYILAEKKISIDKIKIKHNNYYIMIIS